MDLNINELQMCDILLYNSTGLFSNIIKFFGRSEYSHAGLYLGEGQVMEVLTKGILRQSIQDSFGNDTKYIGVYRHKNITDKNREQILKNADIWFSRFKNYSGWQISYITLLYLTRFSANINSYTRKLIYKLLNTARKNMDEDPKKFKEAMICSEFVYRVFDNVCNIHITKLCESLPKTENVPIDDDHVLSEAELTRQLEQFIESQPNSPFTVGISFSETDTNEEEDIAKLQGQKCAILNEYRNIILPPCDDLPGYDNNSADLVTPNDLSKSKDLRLVGKYRQ